MFSFPLHPPYTLALDFTANNADLQTFDFTQPDLLEAYIQGKLQAAGAIAGIGGYNEHRILYRDKALFGEERCIHLGVDIWLPAGTPVLAPDEGIVHSFQYNEGRGNYGGTIIVEHRWQDQPIYALYGHLSLDSLTGKSVGMRLQRGEAFAALGSPEENGGWAPHLHFQLIRDLRGCRGDYIGVASLAQRESELANCPDPMLFWSQVAGRKSQENED